MAKTLVVQFKDGHSSLGGEHGEWIALVKDGPSGHRLRRRIADASLTRAIHLAQNLRHRMNGEI